MSVAEAELIVELARAEALREQWDQLAVAQGEPTSAPAWMLGWWRHVAPRGAQLRIVAVHERGELIGLLPLFVDLSHRSRAGAYRLMAHDFSSAVSPLAAPDREWDVGQAATRLLAAQPSPPDSLVLEPVLSGSVWPAVLRASYPGPIRPMCWQLGFEDAPTVSLRYPSFERWLASRSANFRSNARRNLSRFREAGGSSRLSTRATLADDIELFIELHRTRWQELTARGAGESRLLALGDRLPRLLRELGDALLAADRFHLRILEVRGRPVGAELSIAAGGEIDTINYGWDGRFRRASPLAVGLLERIDEGIRRGEHRMSLGRSLSRFKLGFADGRAPVTRSVVVPVGAGLPAALRRAVPQVARRRLRETARRVLSEQHLELLRAANTRTRNAIARKGPEVERGDPN